MIYCMSDIHGHYDRYQQMLQTISFSDEDVLYVLGDAIDRGPQGVDVVRDIMSRSNVVFLRGNHEQMCLADLYQRDPSARWLWQSNGGSPTRRQLLYKCTPAVRNRILHFFRNAKVSADVEVDGKRFILVHGLPSDNLQEQLWGRPELSADSPVSGATVIVGHTPTVLITGAECEPFRIWHGNGIIDIDCGCGMQTEFGRLACLRLNDMQEFYIS